MKKFGLIVLGVIAVIVFMAHIGSLIALLISLAILYFAFRKFIRARSAGSKIFWALIGIIALFFSIGNIPAIIAAVALAAIYFVYKSWKKNKTSKPEPDDPFDNFEKQWKEMM
ncbi:MULTISPECIES: lmo0954 family membrane protein [unclassified Sporolactobacillus]|uniref:lmo0954 family membrane protein n=1 Tax=unclassified Sporolactobacillus TaxID=2628533 RepID=UPI0023675198|nr:flagellar basal body rod protein [Sporolactobacillus sp. CQH2019]MDD9150402.1 flagellar basal body rod protein [Sporolactobacillus sp. CQH2019]